MGKPDIEQVRLTHRGREFHFVSYEGQREDRKRNRAATYPTWYLMNSGKRWEVMAHQRTQEHEERDRLFAAWLERHVFPAATQGEGRR